MPRCLMPKSPAARLSNVLRVAAYSIFLVLGAFWGQSANSPLRWRWSNPLPHGGNIFDMVRGFGGVVQVAERGQLYTSDDLTWWVPRDSGTTNALRSATFFGNRLVISGERGTIVYADSLEEYRVVDLGTADWLEGIAASPTTVVAVGDNAAIYLSTNGVSWTRRPAPFAQWLRSVAYSPELETFVAVGEEGLLASSQTGSTWTVRDSGTSRNLNRVAWLSGKFWVVGEGGVVLNNSGSQVSRWTAVSISITNRLSAVTGDQTSTYVVAGDQALRRREGSSWQDETDPAKAFPAPKWTYYSAVYDTDLFFVAGRSGMMVEGFRSGGGSPWTWVTREEPVRSWLWDVWRAPEVYVAVGDRATILSSVDGVDWDLELPPSTATNSVLLGIGGSTNLLIAAGSRGTVILSPSQLTTVLVTNGVGQVTTNVLDTMGILWQAATTSVTNDLQGVARFGDSWVVTGSEGTILTSGDATNWIKRSSPVAAHLSSVAASATTLVAVGKGGTLLTSPDGVTWDQRAPGTTNWLYRVRYLNGTLVVVGEMGTILTSSDGEKWTPRLSGTTRWLTDVSFLDGKYYVCGHQGALLTSSDLANWTYLGTITEKSLFGLAHAGGRLVAAGVEGSILRAEVVPDNAPVQFLAFDRSDFGNLYLLSGSTGQRFTLDRASELSSWTRGPVYEFLDSTGTLLLIEDTGTNAPPREFYRATLVP